MSPLAQFSMSPDTVYVSVALVWLRVVDGVPLTLRDLVGVVVVLAGMGVLMGGGQRG